MQELAIWSQIPLVREKQVLGILAGLTGTQPAPICEQTLIFAQTKAPEVTISRRAKQAQQQQQQQQQNTRLRYEKLTRNVSVGTEGEPWQFRAEHIPDPGPPNVIQTRFVEQRADATADIQRIKRLGLYRYSGQFLIAGNRFVFGNVIIRVMRYLLPPPAHGDPTESPPPTPQDLRLVDASGACLVEAVIRVEDESNAKLTSLAKDELNAFTATMDGAVVFKVADRLALDTRVKVM